MKKARFLFTFLFLLTLTTLMAFAADIQPEAEGSITGSTVNFREGPSTSTAVLTTFKKGDKVKVVGSENEWVKVEADGKTGYVHSDYILVDGAVTTEATQVNMTGTITGSVVNVRKGAGTSYSVIGKLIRGDIVDVIEQGAAWTKISIGTRDGYVSNDYISVTSVAAASSKPKTVSGLITGSLVRIRAGASTESEILFEVPENTQVLIMDPSSSWMKVIYQGRIGYVSSDYIKVIDSETSRSLSSARPNSDAASLAEEIIAYGKEFLGVKYKYGGSSPSGFDCGGFVKYVLAEFGYKLPMGATSQYNTTSVLTHIKRSELMPGDLVYWRSRSSKKIQHTGIYIGNNKFIHASSPGDVVKIDSMASGYYDTYYYGAARFLPY